MPLLEVKGLQKTYGGRRVVDGVDFHVGRSEIVGLLGPNGAGKTTTFRMVMGMIRSEAGAVNLSGEDISSLPMYQRARRGMGYLSQEPSIFRNMTVQDNVMAILETQHMDARERRERLAELLTDLGLLRLSQSMAANLSGGERRRLEISRALVTNPEILLLDEPFSGVDPKACEDIQKIVSNLRQRGMSILLTDHNVFETFTIVDRAYIIRDGRVLKHGTPQELVNDKEARRLYLGDKFSEYGEAFSELRKQIESKGRSAPAPRIGRTTRIIRMEEAEHRRQMMDGMKKDALSGEEKSDEPTADEQQGSEE
ncbi:MAG: LPS export ABC transporter ATP-binding protein [Planctomycetes bacterium]|nr:LPS export ABC transporter ATP-binding protein [Planctomycetota bacterium]